MKWVIFILIIAWFYFFIAIDTAIEKSYNEWFSDGWKFACEKTFTADWIDFIPDVWCWDKEAGSFLWDIYYWERK